MSRKSPSNRYRWVRGEGFVPVEDFAPVERTPGPYVMSDIEPYRSPLGTGEITSRSHRREDLKRGGCREVDPSEFRPTYRNARFAKKHGLKHTPAEEA